MNIEILMIEGKWDLMKEKEARWDCNSCINIKKKKKK